MDKTIIEYYLQKLEQLSVCQQEEIKGWQIRRANFIEPGQYEFSSSWADYAPEIRLPAGETIFFRTRYRFPACLTADEPLYYRLNIKLLNLEGYIKVNGKVYHGLDRNRQAITVDPAWAGKDIELEMECFNLSREKVYGQEPGLVHARLEKADRNVESFLYDLQLAYDTLYLEEGLARRLADRPGLLRQSLGFLADSLTGTRLMQAVERSLQKLDLTLCGNQLCDAVARAGKLLKEELAAIDDGKLKGKVHLVGHTHIDVAWLWQLKDTVRKCGHSFANAIKMLERHPDYKFSSGQAQLYAYTKEYYPELYARIKELIAAGRWEPVGPMWVESDCNVISGESLVRQLLHGQMFYRDEFGKDSDICWLPDTFGFQPNIPQILKLAGIRYFYSYKLHWQSKNRFPYGSFRWRGLDGSEVLAAVPELLNHYNGTPCPAEVSYAQQANLQKDTINDVLMPYGYGDGGGGPTEQMLETARRLANYPLLPECQISSAAEFFRILDKEKEKLPIWYGELYLETHRGTYTTHGQEKRANRHNETLLQTAEKIAVLAGLSGFEADWSKLKQAWQDLLLLQFHDILPGSSISAVYDDAAPVYEKIKQTSEEIIYSALQCVLTRAEAVEDNEEYSVIVFNPLSFPRSETVCVEIPEAYQDGCFIRGKQANDLAGRIENGMLTFPANDVPALGIAGYKLVKGQSPGAAEPYARITANSGTWLIETDNYLLTLEQSGCVSSIYDRLRQREVLAGTGNEFLLFLDGPQLEDAWNLYSEYRQRPVEAIWGNEVEIKHNDTLGTVIHLRKKSEKIVINQEIILNAGEETIVFRTRIDWQEEGKLLKVSFPLNVHTAYAACDTGFGTYLRPTFANTPFDREKFEVIAHKWVDLSEGDYGVALLNDCKYGHSIEGNRLEISLLRSTGSPDPQADRGTHEICYALYPHQGDWRSANTTRAGLGFNTPMPALVSKNQPAQEGESSLAEVDQENIILDTIKQSWDGQNIVMRLFEAQGSSGRAKLDFSLPARKVYEVNLLEEKGREITTDGSSFCFRYRPFEIKSFLLEIL